MKEILSLINRIFEEKIGKKILIEISFTDSRGYEPQLTIIKGVEKSLWSEFELFDLADIIH